MSREVASVMHTLAALLLVASAAIAADDTRPRIVAFGDSLTAGFGVGQDESYPAQLQRRLDRAGYRYRVINAGVSGETTAGGLRRVDWVLKAKPSIVILELGANDGLRGLDPESTRANLDAIIRRLKDAGVTVVLAGMKLPPNYGEAYTRRFADIYVTLARAYRLPFMPFFLNGVGGEASLNLPDGIHPTGEGYRRVVEELMPVLSPLLERAAGAPAAR
ncbi:MAG TPA: arylesterase [Nitrospirales bacterium]|nr:arylesterase [Nitrospirales bacterium]